MRALSVDGLVGLRFTRMTITSVVGRKPDCGLIVDAVCDCGNNRRLPLKSLRSGNTKSCGCARREASGAALIAMCTTHGRSKTPAYIRWWHMLRRCEDPKTEAFRDYGARGIGVCARWHDVVAYASDTGDRPTPRHTLDRTDNDGGYWCGRAECPECGPLGRVCNVRWATRSEQAYNSRRALWVTVDGVKRRVVDVCGEHRTTLSAFRARVASGWDPVAAATTPSTATDIEKVRASWRTRRNNLATKEATP